MPMNIRECLRLSLSFFEPFSSFERSPAHNKKLLAKRMLRMPKIPKNEKEREQMGSFALIELGRGSQKLEGVHIERDNELVGANW